MHIFKYSWLILDENDLFKHQIVVAFIKRILYFPVIQFVVRAVPTSLSTSRNRSQDKPICIGRLDVRLSNGRQTKRFVGLESTEHFGNQTVLYSGMTETDRFTCNMTGRVTL